MRNTQNLLGLCCLLLTVVLSMPARADVLAVCADGGCVMTQVGTATSNVTILVMAARAGADAIEKWQKKINCKKSGIGTADMDYINFKPKEKEIDLKRVGRLQTRATHSGQGRGIVVKDFTVTIRDDTPKGWMPKPSPIGLTASFCGRI